MAFRFQPPAPFWQPPWVYIFPLLTQAVVPRAEKHPPSIPSSAEGFGKQGSDQEKRLGWDLPAGFAGARAGRCIYGRAAVCFLTSPALPAMDVSPSSLASKR